MNQDRALVETFLSTRDEPSFRALYRSHTPYLFALACRLAGGVEDVAEDLVEDAWVRAVSGLSGFEWRSQLRSWLAGILINCHRERSRTPTAAREAARGDGAAESRGGAVAGAADAGGGGGSAIDARLDLERALARLADGYREVVVLYHVYGYKHREIAELLRVSEGTSKSQLARGMARLREALGSPPLRPTLDERAVLRGRAMRPDERRDGRSE